jgi:hypothetical protein
MTAKLPAFVDNFRRFTELSDLIRRDLPVFTYRYMPEDEFRALFLSNVGAGNRVYAQELLFRAHWAALASIFRNRRWMNGIDAALKGKNFFSFCACLRGLLESAADSHEAMYASMATVAENFAAFRSALAGNFSEAVFCCEPLENILIHFTHGRRVARSEVVPPAHRAKTVQDYLANFEEAGERTLRDLYAELCEVTHPAAITVHLFGEADASDSNAIRFVDPNDMRFIASLLKRHDGSFVILFQKSFNAALLTLFVLNQFDDKRFYTPGAADVSFKKVPAFSEIEQKIRDSHSGLLNALAKAR